MTLSPTAFHDRRDGGLLLGERLLGLHLDDPVIYAVPRGGVAVAVVVAAALSCPIELLFVRKVRGVDAPDILIAAVGDDAPLILRRAEIVREAATTRCNSEPEIGAAADEIVRRRALYMGNRATISPRGRTAVLVDDGIATGDTAVAAVRALRAQGADRVIVAAPVGASGALDRLAWEADAVICPVQPQDFTSVERCYGAFGVMDDGEVTRLLTEARTSNAAA